MFKDYYKILGVYMQSSQEDIKSAYREMSKKYHPDRNPNIDTTILMQDVNEAYAILKDPIKRSRYDKEYSIFSQTYRHNDIVNAKNKTNWTYDYVVGDVIVKSDIEEARNFAEGLGKDNASSGAVGVVGSSVKRFISAILIFLILGLCIRAFLHTEEQNAQNKEAHNDIQLSFDTTANGMTLKTETFVVDNGFGYTISVNGKVFIEQDVIPGISEYMAFKKKEDAFKVGKLVIKKMLASRELPTVSVQELINLGVELPDSITK